jgi:hypothetical protein
MELRKQVSLFTISGDSSTSQIDISKLNKGVYLISIKNADGSQQFARFVKI